MGIHIGSLSKKDAMKFMLAVLLCVSLTAAAPGYSHGGRAGGYGGKHGGHGGGYGHHHGKRDALAEPVYGDGGHGSGGDHGSQPGHANHGKMESHVDPGHNHGSNKNQGGSRGHTSYGGSEGPQKQTEDMVGVRVVEAMEKLVTFKERDTQLMDMEVIKDTAGMEDMADTAIMVRN